MWAFKSTDGWPTPEQLIERNRDGERWADIAKQLNVSREKVRHYVRGEGDRHRREALERGEIKIDATDDYRAILIAINRIFERRMTEAIELGLEQAPIGIKKDYTPHPSGRLAIGGSPFSGCGSAAATCVEMADPKW